MISYSLVYDILKEYIGNNGIYKVVQIFGVIGHGKNHPFVYDMSKHEGIYVRCEGKKIIIDIEV